MSPIVSRAALLLLAAIFLLSTIAACKRGPSEAAKEPAAESTKPVTTPPPTPPKPETPTLFAGAHILVAYKGAARPKPSVTRSKQEAEKLAKELAAKAKKAPDTFAELAKQHSDGPSGPRGGSLGAWPKGRMVPAFDAAIEKMKVGEISDPVETQFGFHVIRRLEPILAGSHILVAYKGAARARPDVTRSKQEAEKLAKELAAKAKKAPDTFAELAKQHSNGPSGPKGGSLGKWNRGRMVPAFDMAIDTLKIGEISDPVETQFGFHVIKRDDPTTVTP